MTVSSDKLINAKAWQIFSSEILEGLADPGFVCFDTPNGDLAWENLWKSLSDCNEDLFANHQMTPAKIGSSGQQKSQTTIRGDSIFWIEKNNPKHEILNQTWAFLDHLKQHLKENLRLPLTEFEAHLAHYPPGTGYHKHLDQPQNSQDRLITFILYLNQSWGPADGGRLQVYHKMQDTDPFLSIEPIGGRWIFFRSELFPHQVEISKKSRKSLTGWFKNKQKYL